MIETIDWAAFTATGAEGEALARAISLLIDARVPAVTEQAWRDIENTAFAQETVYQPAEPVVDVMLAALANERPQFVREWIVEVLFFIMRGGSASDPSLPERCRSRARLGLWLLAHEAAAISGPARDRVLDVIDLIERPFGIALRRALVSG